MIACTLMFLVGVGVYLAWSMREVRFKFIREDFAGFPWVGSAVGVTDIKTNWIIKGKNHNTGEMVFLPAAKIILSQSHPGSCRLSICFYDSMGKSMGDTHLVNVVGGKFEQTGTFEMDFISTSGISGVYNMVEHKINDYKLWKVEVREQTNNLTDSANNALGIKDVSPRIVQ